LTVESWIKEGDQDKSKMYGYDLPNGTWFVKMKIENNDLWEKIKAGELKGLSIEGYFVDKMEKMSKTVTDEEIVEAYNELVKEGKINKVELGLADDLKDLIKRGLKIEKDIKREINKYNGLLRAGGEFKKKYSNYVEQAKQLGVPVPRELKSLEKIADGFEKKGNALKKVFNIL
jgi:hypothetical protein